MLLAPQNARSWAPRVRRIIFDEIHCMSQAEDGIVWEQLLLLAPCPIVALSATVGNPNEFADWLRASQDALGHKMTMIRHQHRYSDLRKFVYDPPAPQSAFTGLKERPATEDQLSLDGLAGFSFVHPIAGLMYALKGMPEDLALEPRDCLTLARTMVKHWPSGRKRAHEVTDPDRRFPAFIKQSDIISWNRALKAEIEAWQQTQPDSVRSVVHELGGDIDTKSVVDSSSTESDDKAASMLPLLSSLHAAGALPALIFNYDRYECEAIAKTVLEQLLAGRNDVEEEQPGMARQVREMAEVEGDKREEGLENRRQG